jgi:predicted RNA-binding protein YlxR (DUF448 family)
VLNATFRPLYSREREPVLIVQEAGWAPETVWTGTENLAPTGNRSRSVQPIASRCTGYAITAPQINILISGKLRYPETLFPRRYRIKHILLYTEFFFAEFHKRPHCRPRKLKTDLRYQVEGAAPTRSVWIGTNMKCLDRHQHEVSGSAPTRSVWIGTNKQCLDRHQHEVSGSAPT